MNNNFLDRDANALAESLTPLWFILTLLVVGVVLLLFYFITLSKIFKKAGIKGWIAWVPYYNIWKFFEMGNLHPALSLLILGNTIPYIGWLFSLASIVLSIIAAYNIGKGFGKKGSFTLLYIFLFIVWQGILAFGKDKWSGKMYKKVSTAPTPPAAPTPPTSTNS